MRLSTSQRGHWVFWALYSYYSYKQCCRINLMTTLYNKCISIRRPMYVKCMSNASATWKYRRKSLFQLTVHSSEISWIVSFKEEGIWFVFSSFSLFIPVVYLFWWYFIFSTYFVERLILHLNNYNKFYSSHQFFKGKLNKNSFGTSLTIFKFFA